MRGKQYHTIDAKNRLFVPSKFREELGNEIVIAQSVLHDCIWVYSKESWEKFEEKIGTLPEFGAYDVVSWISDHSEDGKVDGQGRIALPEDYVKGAKIKKNIVSRGVRDHMEIWDQEEYERYAEGVDVSGLRKYLIEHGL